VSTSTDPLHTEAPPTPRLSCRQAGSPEALREHRAIRHQVFVLEQGIFAGSDEDERDRKGLPPWWPWAAAAAAVLVVVLATASLAGSGSPEPAVADPGASSEASESPSERPSKKADDRIRVREADYLGRDAKEVKRELEARGFEVKDEKVPATSADQAKDTVAAVRPHGLVEPGSTITLEVYEEFKPPKPEKRDWDEDSEDGDEGDDDESGRWSDGHPGKGKGHDD